MTTEEKIQECEEICINIDKTPWQKFKELIYHYCDPYEKINIQGNIDCPICESYLDNNDVMDDFDICSIIVENDKAFYEIVTPCCGATIYTTDNWRSNLHTEDEMWNEARNRYRENFLQAGKTYDYAKQHYITLCDLIYERDQRWKKI